MIPIDVSFAAGSSPNDMSAAMKRLQRSLLPETMKALLGGVVAGTIADDIRRRVRSKHTDRYGKALAPYVIPRGAGGRFIRGGKRGSVDLTETGAMLDSMGIVGKGKDTISIGFSGHHGKGITNKMLARFLSVKRDFFGLTREQETRAFNEMERVFDKRTWPVLKRTWGG